MSGCGAPPRGRPCGTGPRRPALRQELRGREVEDAMAVPSELGRQLLGTLEAEVPVDDREDDHVVAASRDGGQRIRRARGAPFQAHERVRPRDRSEAAAHPAGEGPGDQPPTGGEERRPRRGGAAQAVAGGGDGAARPLRLSTQPPQPRLLPPLDLRERILEVLPAQIRFRGDARALGVDAGDLSPKRRIRLRQDAIAGRDLSPKRRIRLRQDAIAGRDLFPEKRDPLRLLGHDAAQAADLLDPARDRARLRIVRSAPHPDPLPRGEGGRWSLRKVVEPFPQRAVSDVPGVLAGDLPAACRQGLLVRTPRQRALERAVEVFRSIVELDDVRRTARSPAAAARPRACRSRGTRRA